mmetsp:Transcript_56759/g.135190  ORF Transcript_56759/g.135190 Transcript_56759/m.135190 type:complete len:660 (-) Transcript_56759:1480-3459(-)
MNMEEPPPLLALLPAGGGSAKPELVCMAWLLPLPPLEGAGVPKTNMLPAPAAAGAALLLDEAAPPKMLHGAPLEAAGAGAPKMLPPLAGALLPPNMLVLPPLAAPPKMLALPLLALGAPPPNMESPEPKRDGVPLDPAAGAPNIGAAPLAPEEGAGAPNIEPGVLPPLEAGVPKMEPPPPLLEEGGAPKREAKPDPLLPELLGAAPNKPANPPALPAPPLEALLLSPKMLAGALPPDVAGLPKRLARASLPFVSLPAPAEPKRFAGLLELLAAALPKMFATGLLEDDPPLPGPPKMLATATLDADSAIAGAPKMLGTAELPLLLPEKMLAVPEEAEAEPGPAEDPKMLATLLLVLLPPLLAGAPKMLGTADDEPAPAAEAKMLATLLLLPPPLVLAGAPKMLPPWASLPAPPELLVSLAPPKMLVLPPPPPELAAEPKRPANPSPAGVLPLLGGAPKRLAMAGFAAAAAADELPDPGGDALPKILATELPEPAAGAPKSDAIALPGLLSSALSDADPATPKPPKSPPDPDELPDVLGAPKSPDKLPAPPPTDALSLSPEAEPSNRDGTLKLLPAASALESSPAKMLPKEKPVVALPLLPLSPPPNRMLVFAPSEAAGAPKLKSEVDCGAAEDSPDAPKSDGTPEGAAAAPPAAGFSSAS